jgi:hypothetical protein
MRRNCGFYFAGDEKYDLLRDNKYKNILVELYINDNDEIVENAPNIVKSTLEKVFENKNIIIKINEPTSEKDYLTIEDIIKYDTDLENENTKVLFIIVTNQRFEYIFDTEGLYSAGFALRSRTILVRYPTPTHYEPKTSMEYLLWWSEEYPLSLIEVDDKNRIFEHILLHELGHILGLRHTDTPGCIMNPSFMANLSQEYSSEDDYTIEVGEIPLEYCEEEKFFLNEITNIPLIRTREYLEDYYNRKRNF